MPVSKFYTLFWIIYYPFCLVLYESSQFQYVDELLTMVLFAYLFLGHKIREQSCKQEFYAYLLIITGYLLYSFVISVTTPKGVILDFFQQLRPYIVFYSTWILAPHLSNVQKKIILFVTLTSSLIYFYILYRNTGLVDGEYGMLSVIFLACGIAYCCFAESTPFNKCIALIIILLGLFSGKSKYMGQCVVFIYLMFFLKRKIIFHSIGTYISMLVVVSAVIFFAWDKFNAYYIDGFKADAEEIARPMSYVTGLKILKDYIPFGSGLGSFCTAAAAKEYSPLYYKYELDHIWGLSPDNPMFIADCYYPSLAEFGVVGVILFLIFWKRRLNDIQKIRDIKFYRLALMCVLALAIDSTSNTAYLSGGGMVFFVILAICLNSNRNERHVLG